MARQAKKGTVPTKKELLKNSSKKLIVVISCIGLVFLVILIVTICVYQGPAALLTFENLMVLLASSLGFILIDALCFLIFLCEYRRIGATESQARASFDTEVAGRPFNWEWGYIDDDWFVCLTGSVKIILNRRCIRDMLPPRDYPRRDGSHSDRVELTVIDTTGKKTKYQAVGLKAADAPEGWFTADAYSKMRDFASPAYLWFHGQLPPIVPSTKKKPGGAKRKATQDAATVLPRSAARKPALVPGVAELMLPIDEAVETDDGFGLVEFRCGNKKHSVSVWPPEKGDDCDGYMYKLDKAEFTTRDELMRAPFGDLSFAQAVGPFKVTEVNGCYPVGYEPFVPFIQR